MLRQLKNELVTLTSLKTTVNNFANQYKNKTKTCIKK